MNKKGFAFIETVVTIAILCTSLILIYNSYSSFFTDENNRLYYDDPAYIYRTSQIRTFLTQHTSINILKNIAFDSSYIEAIGPSYSAIYSEENISDEINKSFENIFNSFDVSELYVVDTSLFTEEDSEKYQNSFSNVPDDIKRYLNTLSVKSSEYILVAVYKETYQNSEFNKCFDGDNNCHTYYAYISLSLQDEEVADPKNFADYLIEDVYKGIQGNNNIYYHNGTLSGDIKDYSYRYSGADEEVNNYVCFGSDEKKCPEDNLYRILGVFDKRVKLIKSSPAKSNLLGTDGEYRSGNNYRYSSEIMGEDISWYGNNNWAESKLNTINLNTNFLNNIGSTWASKIDTNTWLTGGNRDERITQVTPLESYNAEMISPCERKTYTSKIGLSYVNDLSYAMDPKYWTLTTLSNYDTYKKYNWYSTFYDHFSITSYTYECTEGNRTYHYTPSFVYIISDHPYSDRAIDEKIIYPVFYLLSSIEKTKGDGTKINPYRIN